MEGGGGGGGAGWKLKLVSRRRVCRNLRPRISPQQFPTTDSELVALREGSRVPRRRGAGSAGLPLVRGNRTDGRSPQSGQEGRGGRERGEGRQAVLPLDRVEVLEVHPEEARQHLPPGGPPGRRRCESSLIRRRRATIPTRRDSHGASELECRSSCMRHHGMQACMHTFTCVCHGTSIGAP